LSSNQVYAIFEALAKWDVGAEGRFIYWLAQETQKRLNVGQNPIPVYSLKELEE